CVVMSLDLLGEGFDLHGGGQDLAFPHHENERAQAVAAGCTFARRWAISRPSTICWTWPTPAPTGCSSSSPTGGRPWR
ncbi:MAG: hypothetical protein LC792_13675, partial [Actinobacteria bacterium]|nr:hypothetical protein [Actinomycetota bacterium]